jgi:hypothetical protein
LLGVLEVGVSDAAVAIRAGLIRKDDVEMVMPKVIELVATDQALTIAPEPYWPVVAH